MSMNDTSDLMHFRLIGDGNFRELRWCAPGYSFVVANVVCRRVGQRFAYVIRRENEDIGAAENWQAVFPLVLQLMAEEKLPTIEQEKKRADLRAERDAETAAYWERKEKRDAAKIRLPILRLLARPDLEADERRALTYLLAFRFRDEPPKER